MSEIVVNGAEIMCSFALPPGKAALVVTPKPMVDAGTQPAATIMDFAPMKNIPTFGSCTAPTNLQVIAAQGAPVPCIPIVTEPWTPGSPTVQLGSLPALTSDSKCTCKWLGLISISKAGQKDATTG